MTTPAVLDPIERDNRLEPSYDGARVPLYTSAVAGITSVVAIAGSLWLAFLDENWAAAFRWAVVAALLNSVNNLAYRELRHRIGHPAPGVFRTEDNRLWLLPSAPLPSGYQRRRVTEGSWVGYEPAERGTYCVEVRRTQTEGIR